MIPSSDLSFDNINSIDPDSVYLYLQNGGWKEVEKIDDRAIIFMMQKNDKRYSLLLPLAQDIPDFYSRMYDVLRVLEAIENRPKTEILNCFKNSHQIAFEQQTEIISLRFQFIYDQGKNKFSAKKIGLVLVSLQELFDAVGEFETGKEKDNTQGKIAKYILEQTEISVFETFKGSFGVRLAFARLNQQLNFLENPLSERISQQFLELIKLSNNPDKENLKQILLKLKKKIASRYRKFLAELNRDQSNFYIDWGSLNPESGGHAYLSYENIVTTIDFINKMETENPEEIIVRGKLLSASKSNRNYLEILSYDNQEKYRGDILDSALKDENNEDIDLTIEHEYIVTFEQITSIHPATGEEKIERKVIKIEPIS